MCRANKSTLLHKYTIIDMKHDSAVETLYGDFIRPTVISNRQQYKNITLVRLTFWVMAWIKFKLKALSLIILYGSARFSTLGYPLGG